MNYGRECLYYCQIFNTQGTYGSPNPSLTWFPDKGGGLATSSHMTA